MELSYTDLLGESVSRDAYIASTTTAAQSAASHFRSDSPDGDRDLPARKKRKKGRSLLPGGGHPSSSTASTASSPHHTSSKSPLFRSNTALNILQGRTKSPPILGLGPATGSPTHQKSHLLNQSATSPHLTPLKLPPNAALTSFSSTSSSASAHPKPAATKKPFRAPPISKLERERMALPIYQSRDAILNSLRTQPNLIVLGETGSGKTTQLPQYLLSSGLLGRSSVGVTQPRRVAAISVATRVAEEYGCALGQQVGYSIRFEDVTSEKTRIKYITDGMLLREIMMDPFLANYNAIVLDEAHERSLNTDILFALLKQVQRVRIRIIEARKMRDKARKEEREKEKEKGKSPRQSPHHTAATSSSSKSPRRSPTTSTTAAAAHTSTMLLSPDMRPLDLASDTEPPKSKAQRKEEKRKRKREARERMEKGEKDGASTTASSPPIDDSFSSTATTSAISSYLSSGTSTNFSLDSSNTAELPHLDSISNLDNLQELKLVIMSATLSSELFSRYFDNAPILTVSGRTYPVDLMYAEQPQVDYLDSTIVAVLQIHLDKGDGEESFEPPPQITDGDGDTEMNGDNNKQSSSSTTHSPPSDILVFLTGSEEIETARRTLEEKMRRIENEWTASQVGMVVNGSGEDGEDGPTTIIPRSTSSSTPKPLSMLICPLYANLPSEAQMSVFQPAPPNTRKVILSTNIAETSLTIPGIRYVIDSGVTKLRLYNPRTGGEILKVCDISQAEAKQRSGRAGRDAPGVALRLYTESAFSHLKPDLIPEILRTNLSTVVLQLKNLHIQNIMRFEFMTHPGKDVLAKALEELYSLQALTYNGGLSNLGRLMVYFPIPPVWSKMLLKATEEEYDCAKEVAKIVAVMSVEGIFLNNTGNRNNNNNNNSSNTQSKQQRQRQFSHSEGDHFTYLDAFNAYTAFCNGLKEKNGSGGNNKKRKNMTAATPSSSSSSSLTSTNPHRALHDWCISHGLNQRHCEKVTKIYEQLGGIIQRLGLRWNSVNEREMGEEYSTCVNTEPIKKCLLFGLYKNIARKQAHDNSYLTLHDSQVVYIHPSSVLIGKTMRDRPELVCYNILVQTSRQYMREIMILKEMKMVVELMPNVYGGGESSTTEGASSTTASRIRGGKQAHMLAERLAGEKSQGNGSTNVASTSSASASSSSHDHNASNNSTKKKKNKKKQKVEVASAPLPAAAAAFKHSTFDASFSSEKQPRPPKSASKKASSGSNLLDFVNSL